MEKNTLNVWTLPREQFCNVVGRSIIKKDFLTNLRSALLCKNLEFIFHNNTNSSEMDSFAIIYRHANFCPQDYYFPVPTKITELDQTEIDDIRSSYPREFWQDVYALRTLAHVIDEIVLDIPNSEEYISVRSYIDDIIGSIEECVDCLDGYHKEEYDPDEPKDTDKSELAELLKNLASDMAYQYSESPSMQGVFPNSYNNKSASVQENINQKIEAFWDSANNAVSKAVSDLRREDGYNSKLYFPNTKKVVE